MLVSGEYEFVSFHGEHPEDECPQLHPLDGAQKAFFKQPADLALVAERPRGQEECFGPRGGGRGGQRWM